MPTHSHITLFGMLNNIQNMLSCQHYYGNKTFSISIYTLTKSCHKNSRCLNIYVYNLGTISLLHMFNHATPCHKCYFLNQITFKINYDNMASVGRILHPFTFLNFSHNSNQHICTISCTQVITTQPTTTIQVYHGRIMHILTM